MFRTALRNILAHKARLIMTALAVVLGTAFVSGTLIFGDSVGQAYENAMTKNYKDVAASVHPEEPRGAAPSEDEGGDGRKRSSVLDDKLAGKIRALPGVASLRPTVSGSAVVVGKDNQPLGAEWGNRATNFSPGKDSRDSRFSLKEGRAPAGADELALDARSAEQGGYRLGDTVTFATDGPALKKKLVGVVTTEDPQVTAGHSLVLLNTATAQKLFLKPGQYDEFTVSAAPGTDDRALTAKVNEVLPKDRAKAISGSEQAAQEAEFIAENTASIKKMLLVFAGIALFVGVFIIGNTFTMLIAQRSREVALMRAVGASRRQVVRSVLVEAALLGLASSAVGFALGAGVALGLRPLLNSTGAGFPDGPLVVNPSAVLSALGVGVLVTVLAAWLPSRKAAKIAPVEALSTVEAPAAPRSLRVRNIIGAAVTALGLAIMLYVSTLEDIDAGMAPAMGGSALTLTGMIILAPLLSRPLVALAGKVTGRLFGVTGKLAKENALRNPRRTAATASALMIGLTMITGMTVAGHSTQQAMDQLVAKDLKADYQVTTSNFEGLDPKVSQKVASVPGVQASAALRHVGFQTKAGDGFGSITGTDLAQLTKVTDLRLASGSLDAVQGNAVAVSRSMAKKTGWKVGDTPEVEFYSGKNRKQKLKIVALYEDNHYADGLLGSPALVDPHVKPLKDEKILIKAAGGASPALEKQIREALGNSPLLKVADKDALRQEGAGNINTALNMMYGLLGMAVVIAVLGVVNTLAMSVFERTREIGMLRAIGLARTGIKQMVRLESIVISLFGAVLGIGVGVFLAWAGGSLAGKSLPTYEMLLPWGKLGLFFLLALVVGVLAAVWPARRAARLNMLESISAQ
ncbi:ABC transporter permease [Streptomyces sp. NPDC001339]|uniref:ABC transporter permease n=1 Tax=Streptomyces sp. NPDC001339 TaxID=3364563 RepID=UPI00367FEC6A